MKILDRYVVRNFLISYLIIGFVLIGLYVLLDLTLNSDEFTERKDSTAADVLADIGNYYGHQVFVYFRDMAGIITLVAAVVTLVTMNRRNEMTAVLASGVSLYRVIWPVVVLGLAFNSLALLNQELAIPSMADQLVRSHDDLAGQAKFRVWSYRMYGAWSDDDHGQVKEVSSRSGGPLLVGAAEAIVRLGPPGAAGPGPGYALAVRQMRPGDILAVHAGQGPAVRAFVKVTQAESFVSQQAVSDAITVTTGDVLQHGHGDFGQAEPGRLDGIQRGDLVVPVDGPYYLFSTLTFLPDRRHYEMVDVEAYKRHPLTEEVLARIHASQAVWDAARQIWVFSPDARIAFLSAPKPGQEHLPNRPDTSAVSPVHSSVTPREIVLRHSSKHWMQFMSTRDLKGLSQSRETSGAVTQARSIMHIRFTKPAINMILLLLGVPFVLTRAPVGLWQGIVKCVLVCGGCFVLAFVCEQVSSDARTWAVVAAWLPVILFGPLAVLLLDSVKT